MSLARTIRSMRRVGLKQWWRDLQYIGDAKSGTLVGKDQFGNKYYENLNPMEEIPGRHRWVDYAQHDYDASQVPPEWHSWLHHIRGPPASEDKVMQNLSPPWKEKWVESISGTRGSFKTYNTTTRKVNSWEPKVSPRQ